MAIYKGHYEDSDGNILLPVGSDICTVETSNRASQAYAVGDFLYYNNTLYKVTSAITSGGTISPGSNCRATTVGEELGSISGSIPSGSGSVVVGGASGNSSSVTLTCDDNIRIVQVFITSSGASSVSSNVLQGKTWINGTTFGVSDAYFTISVSGRTVTATNKTGQSTGFFVIASS